MQKLETMKTYQVKAFNGYTFKGAGTLVIATSYQAKNESHAIRQAHADSIEWNKDASLKVTQLICNGYYRNV